MPEVDTGRDTRRALLEVDDDLRRRVVLDELPELLDDVLGHLGGEQACLA